MPLRWSSADYLFLRLLTFVPALHGHGEGSCLGVKMNRPRPVWSKAPQAGGITNEHAMSQTVSCRKSQPEQLLLRGEVLFELSLDVEQ